MSKTLQHKRYQGSMEVSLEDQCLFGRVLFINDTVTYSGETVAELEEAFREAVDDYLAFCQRTGKQPDKSFSGSFNVRVPRELHRHLAAAAQEREQSLNDYVKQALEQHIESGPSPVSSTGTEFSFSISMSEVSEEPKYEHEKG